MTNNIIRIKEYLGDYQDVSLTHIYEILIVDQITFPEPDYLDKILQDMTVMCR